jgi:hypothetical protein
MYYDIEEKCAVLQASGEAKFPRDLAFNLFEFSCARLTTWHADDLGEDMKVVIDATDPTDGLIFFNQTNTDDHRYPFDPSMSKTVFPLQESPKIPTEFTLTGGVGSIVKSVKIQRYGLSLLEADFPTLWDCINLCSAIASADGVTMSATDVIYLSLLETVQCNKLPTIFAAELADNDERQTGREICTSPIMNVTSVDDLVEILSGIELSSEPYRTAQVYVIEDTFDLSMSSNTVQVPTNRGLQLFVDFDVLGNDDPIISDVNFVVEPSGELFLDSFVLSGSTDINVKRQGDAGGILELSACLIDSTAEPFLTNAGFATLNTCTLRDAAKIVNSDEGFLDLIYSVFQESTELTNAASGTVQMSRMTVYENFTFPFILEGTLELPDARRFYRRVDEEVDPLCLGSDIPGELLDIPSSECESRCEDEFVCSGYFSFFELEEFQVQCGVCLTEAPCEYDCLDNPSSSYLIAESNFFYFSVSACAIKSRKFRTLTGVTLEECKLYCSYYDTCEGFEVVLQNSTRVCSLYADLDFEASCVEDDDSSINRTSIYIPFVNDDPEGFQQVQGNLSLNANVLSEVDSLSYDQCSSLCRKTLRCQAFVIDEISCILYDDNYFAFSSTAEASNTTGLFVSVSDLFPKKRYTLLPGSCQVMIPYDSFNTKTLERCKLACDSDMSCIAYIFRDFVDLFTDNCDAFDRTTVIDSIFPSPALNCTVGVDIYLAYTTESFVLSTEYDRDVDEPAAALKMAFVNERTLTGNLLLDECKSICLQEKTCIAIRHEAQTFTCEIGVPTLSTSLNVTDQFLTLEARPADIGSTYLTVPGICSYRGENITTPSQNPEETKGYARFARVCPAASSVNVISTDSSGNPSDCGLACDDEDSCVGFIHYPDYGSGINENKTGGCDLIGDGATFEKCISPTLTDVYLRGDLASTCQALCNVHQLCSFYVFEENAVCKLFSDMVIDDACDEGDDDGFVVHVGLKYRERDALVKADGQCLVDYEDLGSPGCFIGDNYEDEDLFLQDSGDPADAATPFACQQVCRGQALAYYAVQNSTTCYCTDVDLSEVLTSSSDCTVECSGDASQYCGGIESISVGSSNLPLFDLTLAQCRRTCFEDPRCLAILYDSSSTTPVCELRSSAAFEPCPSNYSGTAIPYIESLEHYYQNPTLAFRGDEVLYRTTATELGCGRICDIFDECEAIRIIQAVTVDNCEILGGNVVAATDSDKDDVLVANDVTLFTKAELYEPDTSALLYSFSEIFDLDECRALCDEHVECGSLLFAQLQCTLYRFSAFAIVSETPPSSYYVGYQGFLVNRQDFTESDGLCVSAAPASSLSSRVTTQSVYQCADRCRADNSCSIFTYDLTNKRDCVLYDSSAILFAPCPNSVTANSFVMYNLGKFTLRSSGFLKGESLLPFKNFSGKSLAECSALCDEYFLCRSFRLKDTTNECKLFTSEQFYTDTEVTSDDGELYTYFSDFNYVPLPSSFCVAATPYVTVTDTQLEACKKMCDLVDVCVSFEHTQNGDCDLYSTSDFSLPCSADLSKTLYISKSRVANL